MAITATVVALGLKWLLAGGISGAGVYGAGRMMCGQLEVDLTEQEHNQASGFEGGRLTDENRSGDLGLAAGEGPLDALADSGQRGDAFNRHCASLACGEGATPAQRGAARSLFMQHWVDEVRLEFPARMDRPSDRAAMAKWLHGELRKRGVRTRHAADMIPRVVALALNRSRAEILGDLEAEAARVRTWGSRFAYEVRRKLHLAGSRKPRAGT